MHRRLVHALLFVGITSLASGCIDFGDLPLPPPSRPKVTAPDTDGQVVVRGQAHPDALVVVGNTRTQEHLDGTPDSSGNYRVAISGESGDELALWQILDAEMSNASSVIVP